MPRYDKYEPFAGGFRAQIAADFGYTNGAPDWNHADLGVMYGVGLDANGRVVVGGGQTGILGVLILTRPKAAGEVVDIMTAGEVVEAGLTPGTLIYADAGTGAVSATAPVAGTAPGRPVGHTVEGDRLIVRLGAPVV